MKKLKTAPAFLATMVAILALTTTGPVGLLAAEKTKADTRVKPYPLDVCIVSDNDLGSMGDERTFVYKGQEIKICCKPCEKKFRKDPDKYLSKLTPKPKQEAKPAPAGEPQKTAPAGQ